MVRGASVVNAHQHAVALHLEGHAVVRVGNHLPVLVRHIHLDVGQILPVRRDGIPIPVHLRRQLCLLAGGGNFPSSLGVRDLRLPALVCVGLGRDGPRLVGHRPGAVQAGGAVRVVPVVLVLVQAALAGLGLESLEAQGLRLPAVRRREE